ncbi:MAG: toxin [Patescibacteria group bacterium]
MFRQDSFKKLAVVSWYTQKLNIDFVYTLSYILSVEQFSWNDDKNQRLKLERNICFEKVVEAIELGSILNVFKHPNSKKYPRQYLCYIKINNYAYIVPYQKNGNSITLITIIPSRKVTKKYLSKKER